MSLGPSTPTNDRVEVIGRFNRIRYSFKKTTKTFFSDALHYTFYIMLLATIAGLFCGMKFSWQYYTILVILAGMKGFNFAYDLWKKETTVKIS